MSLIPFANAPNRREIWSWLLYDFANTIFSMNIITMYFAQWVVIDQGQGDLWYAIPYSISMGITALTMPILGAVSDLLGNRKRFLIILSLSCIGCMLAIGILVGVLDLSSPLFIICMVLFVIANVSYEGAIVFYNALLPGVATPRTLGAVSGWGVALGYLGAIVGLVTVFPFVEGSVFGLDIAGLPGWGRSGAFIPTAILFFLFALPTFIWVREYSAGAHGHTGRGLLRKSFDRLVGGLRATKKYPGVLRFLIADYFFEDAIATVIVFMAIYTEKAMGFPDQDKIVLFMISTVSAIAGSLFWGWLTDWLRPKRALRLAVWGWIGTLCIAAFTTNATVFWILGSFIGIFLGAVWTSSRALLIGLVPSDVIGQFFGLYALSGRAAAIIGPLIWGGIIAVFAVDTGAGETLRDWADSVGLGDSALLRESIQYRLAVLVMAGIMALGLIIYRRIPDPLQNR